MKKRIAFIICLVVVLASSIYFVGSIGADDTKPEYTYEIIETEEGKTTRAYNADGDWIMEETEGNGHQDTNN